jgi:hypothetical protein
VIVVRRFRTYDEILIDMGRSSTSMRDNGLNELGPVGNLEPSMSLNLFMIMERHEASFLSIHILSETHR